VTLSERVRVVLVDDHREVRVMLRTALRLHGGFEVVGEADDGAGAVRLVSSTDPDIVLLDLGLPDLDGREVLTRIRAARPASKVVVFSGADRDDRAAGGNRPAGGRLSAGREEGSGDADLPGDPDPHQRGA